MDTFIFFVLFWLIVGAVSENLDRYYGVALRRFAYNATHGTPLAKADEKGFIVNRDTQVRFIAGLLIVVAWLVLKVIFSSVALEDLLSALFALPVVVAGFLLGPWLGKVWGRRDQFFKAVDALQNDPEKTLKKASSSFMEWAQSFLRGAPEPAVADAPAATAHPEPSAPAETPKPAEAKGLDGFDKYINR